MTLLILSAIRSGLGIFTLRARSFLGIDDSSPAARTTLFGLAASGIFLLATGIWMFLIDSAMPLTTLIALGLLGFGGFNLWTAARKPNTARSNQLALIGHFVALLSFYLISTRFLSIVYGTDSMVGTYLGVLKTLQFQNPYAFSIKPILDQLGLPPSYYTPRIDGTFEFHLNYPALNFLSVIPFYLVGLRDLRDGILIFHLASVITIFGLAPSRLKSLSIIPFALAGPVLVISWTDSVWAFFLLLSAVLWNRKPAASLLLVGLAGAVKQIALVITPFLLIRLWHQSNGINRKPVLLRSAGLILLGFLGPNLPFLFVSPNSWWEATIAPYLPGSPSQVPGGMGLSNILIDLGIAVPTSFYFFMTLAAFIGLLYAYAARFERLNKYLWAFPMILFLFYQRSFPNYIVYWSFPLIFELGRTKGVHLVVPALKARLDLIHWRPVIGRFSGLFHRKFTTAIVIVMIAATVSAGVSGAYVTRHNGPSIQVTVNTVADPDSIGAATLLNVTLENPGQLPVSPVFFVKSSFLPDIWTYNSSQILQGHSTQSYMIRATDAFAAAPKDSNFRVLVSDKLTQQLVGESASTTAKIPTPVVANPHFKWWALDGATGKKVPFGWKLVPKNLDRSAYSIDPLWNNDTSGLITTLNYTSNDNSPSRLALTQKLLFNATSISLSLDNSATNSHTASMTTGVIVTDGTHTLYYLFSSTARTQTIIADTYNATITLPVLKSSWSHVALDPTLVWKSLGWSIPDQATVTIFMETQSKGVYSLGVSEVKEV